MSEFVRLSVDIDHETASAARRLSALLEAHAGADLRAGVKRMSVDTLERIHVAVSSLYYQTSELMELARGERTPITPDGTAEYVFAVVDRSGESIGGVSVRWHSNDPRGARSAACIVFAESPKFDHECTRVADAAASVHVITPEMAKGAASWKR